MCPVRRPNARHLRHRGATRHREDPGSPRPAPCSAADRTRSQRQRALAPLAPQARRAEQGERAFAAATGARSARSPSPPCAAPSRPRSLRSPQAGTGVRGPRRTDRMDAGVNPRQLEGMDRLAVASARMDARQGIQALKCPIRHHRLLVRVGDRPPKDAHGICAAEKNPAAEDDRCGCGPAVDERGA